MGWEPITNKSAIQRLMRPNQPWSTVANQIPTPIIDPSNRGFECSRRHEMSRSGGFGVRKERLNGLLGGIVNLK